MKVNTEHKSELTKEILLGFHTQFAENQRNREQSFLKILTFLAVPVGAYAWVYHYYNSPTNESAAKLDDLIFIQLIASLLIFAGTWIIITIANNFRRDQFVNAKIRKACGLIGDEEIFPMSYNPVISFLYQGRFKWMPDLLLVFYLLFVGVQGVLLAVFLITIKPSWTWFGSQTNETLTFVLFFSVTLFMISLIILPWIYRRKVIDVMNVDKKEYGLKRTFQRNLSRMFNSKDASKSVPAND